MATFRPPSVTTHALLGLLALRPWTAYDLTNQMRRALRYAWPRTEANLYSEIKRLVPRGLARASEEEAGNRVRTRYEITDAGRAAVEDWLRTEPSPVHVQFESLLRVFLADLGTREQLLDTLEATRRQLLDGIEDSVGIVAEYAGHEPPFPERAHLNGLFIAFMGEFHRTVLEWCETAQKEVSTWPATVRVGHTEGTRQMVQRTLDYYEFALQQRDRR